MDQLQNTREIDLLMNKFEVTFNSIDDRVKQKKQDREWINKDISISHLPKYNEIIKRHNIKLEKVEYGNKFWETYYNINSFINNSGVDKELFSLLNIEIAIEKWERNKEYSGQMSYSGQMKIVSGKYQIKNVTAHELGHAWQMQLSKLMGYKLNDHILDTLNYYLKLCGYKPKNVSRGFKRIVGGIGYHITRYAKTGRMEAFAELFMIAYGEIWWESKQLDKWLKRRGYAQKAIKYYNNIVKSKFLKDQTP